MLALLVAVTAPLWACPTTPPTMALDPSRSAWPAGGGDVNGDGYDDLVVFDPQSEGPDGNGQGHMQVFLGTPDGIDPSPVMEAFGPDWIDYLGTAGGIIGDFDGDGYDDILATWEEGAWIFPGSPEGPDAEVFYDVPPIQGGQFGNSAALPGDLDQDGYDDVAIGICNESWDDDGVHVYRGGAGGIAEALLLENPGSYSSGEAMVAAGDVNCDGYPDLVTSGGHNSESVVIYAGGPTIGEQLVKLEAPHGIQRFGRELAATGDVNGDGCDDVLIGHWHGALLYAGHADLEQIAEMSELSGEEISSTSMGDPDGDGVHRVALGRPLAEVAGRAEAGSVTLGDVQIAGQLVELTIDGDEESCELGTRVAGLGDLDADGLPELGIEHDDGWVMVWGDGELHEPGDPGSEDDTGSGDDPTEGCACSSRNRAGSLAAWIALLALPFARRRQRG